jgi:hypothetical protein
VPWAERAHVLAIFGRAHSRELAYQHLRPLRESCRALAIEEILDIGPRGPRLPRIEGIPIREMGSVPGAQLAALLGRCRAGFLRYDAASLAKSAVFAAYCAHGVAPVVAEGGGRPSDGMAPGREYLVAGDAHALSRDLSRLVAASRRWYSGHDVAHHVAWIERALRGGAGEPAVVGEGPLLGEYR